jgi:O-antigen biosynthesis protein
VSAPVAPADWAAVVINWNGAADLPACLAALAAQDWPPAEIVVVDNASTDDSLRVLRRHPRARVIASQANLGFAGGSNRGIGATRAALVATLNPDVTLHPNWAGALRDAFAADPRLGAAGGKLLYPDGATIQHAGGQIEPSTLVATNIGRGEPDRGQYDAPAEVAFLTGGALLLRRAALAAVGAFDESFYPAYYEDVDLCTRLRAGGWAVRYIPTATGIHGESGSVDGASAAYYRMIHGGRLRHAAKHLPLRELVGRFLPAEVARLAAAQQHQAEPGADDRLGLSSFPGPLLAWTAPGIAPPPPTAPVAEVGRRWLVRERPLTSSVPLLGPLIVWLRTRLIEAGPGWHARQILAQQVEFNAAVFRALREIAAEARAATLAQPTGAALLAERLEALAEQQAALAERLRALERRLAALDGPPAADSDPPRAEAEGPGDHEAAPPRPAPGPGG